MKRILRLCGSLDVAIMGIWSPGRKGLSLGEGHSGQEMKIIGEGNERALRKEALLAPTALKTSERHFMYTQ